MQDYRDLKLIGNLSELEIERLIEKIEALLCDGWTRDKERVKEIELKNTDNMNRFAFLTPKDDSIPKAHLYLRFDENRNLSSNIAPCKMDQLSIQDYNLILEKFFTKFIQPAVNDLHIRIVITPAEKNIDNSMSPELSKKLKDFSDGANQSTGCQHPNDRERFIDFIIQAHRESSPLDSSTLEGLLIDEGWSEDFAPDLSSKYYFGRNLLEKYDS